MANPADIERFFTHHPPTKTQAEVYSQLRQAHKTLAFLVDALVPPGVEHDEAIKHLRASVMWSNAGIACAGPKPLDVLLNAPIVDPTSRTPQELFDNALSASADAVVPSPDVVPHG